ncbi:SH3 domain-containing protein 19 [Apodemus speciosus]|uniref:SH3 domain-containing protein 19 n=1 Tax=Apodemus speciosus TaxID=105296 RepID=A0ABQ0ELB4_APOSI
MLFGIHPRVPYQTPALKQDSSPGEWCKALHSFTAETSEDLPFQRGDRIMILERLDPDWYRGRLHDREGIFPAVFVQPCPAETKSVASTVLKGRKVKALYDFLGENEDELSFKALVRLVKFRSCYLDPQSCRSAAQIYSLSADKMLQSPYCFQDSSGWNPLCRPGYPRTRSTSLCLLNTEIKGAGDVITELEPVDDDWMRGELMGRAGIFPKNYVQFPQVS